LNIGSYMPEITVNDADNTRRRMARIGAEA
jgi:hypothetical protein